MVCSVGCRNHCCSVLVFHLRRSFCRVDRTVTRGTGSGGTRARQWSRVVISRIFGLYFRQRWGCRAWWPLAIGGSHYNATGVICAILVLLIRSLLEQKWTKTEGQTGCCNFCTCKLEFPNGYYRKTSIFSTFQLAKYSITFWIPSEKLVKSVGII